jgi:hypothetical protein
MNKVNEKAEELRRNRQLEVELGEIELEVTTNFTLADAIREGSTVTTQECGWGDGGTACALTAAVVSAKSRGFM